MNAFQGEVRTARTIWIITGLLLFASFFQLLSNFAPTADNEHTPSVLLPAIVAQGRFTSYVLLSILAPTQSIHPLDLIIALASFGLAIAIAMVTLGGRSAIPAAIVAASFPTTIHMFTFSSVNMLFGIGVLLGAIGAYAFTRGRYPTSCVAMILTAGIYQGLLLVPVVVVAFYFASRLIAGGSAKDAVTCGLRFVAMLVLSTAFYVVLAWAILEVTGSRLQTVGSTFQLSALLADPTKIVSAAFVFLYRIMAGTEPLYLNRGAAIASGHAFVILVATYVCVRRCSDWSTRLLAIAFVSIGLSAPFLSGILTGGDVRYRSLLAAPLAMAGLVYIAAQSRSRILFSAVMAASICLTMLYSQATVQLIRGAILSWEADREVTQKIVARIVSIDPQAFEKGRAMPFEMVGWLDRETPWIPRMGARTTLGFSFFRYTESPQRAMGAMSMMGYPNFRGVTADERLSMYPKTLSMPVWPAEGSIAVIDGVAVVKFAPRYTNFQVTRYCGNRPPEECSLILSRSN